MTVTEDSGLFVYAVVRADHPLSHVTGLDGEELRLVPFAEVAAVVSETPLPRPQGRRADLTAYSEAVTALMAQGALAPIQFGHILRDDREVVEELLAPRLGELTDLLDLVEGRVQYNLRATYVEDAVLSEIVLGDPEIRDLRDRTRGLPPDAAVGDRIRLGELVARAWERQARADADHLLRQMDPMLAARSLRREPGQEAVLDVALLVDRARAQEVEDRLEDLAEAADGRVRLRLTGPVAAYDFVGTS
jgi:hypothetical protein